MVARPIGQGGQGAWQTLEVGVEAQLAPLAGSNPYQARRGASTDPYGVFWLRVLDVRPDGLLLVENLPEHGKRPIAKIQHVIESDLVYPAVRGADIARWAATPRVHVLIPQDMTTREGYSEVEMRARWPHTYAYLLHFREILLTRGSQVIRELAERTVFWTMYGIGPYTFAPYRVAWKRMATDLIACVLSSAETSFGRRPIVPTETTAFIPVEHEAEAHYLCAILNSLPVRLFIQSFSSAGRGFGAPSVMAQLAMPTFDVTNAVHERLAGLSKEAHQQHDPVEIQALIDDSAAQLWGVDLAHLSKTQLSSKPSISNS